MCRSSDFTREGRERKPESPDVLKKKEYECVILCSHPPDFYWCPLEQSTSSPNCFGGLSCLPSVQHGLRTYMRHLEKTKRNQSQNKAFFGFWYEQGNSSFIYVKAEETTMSPRAFLWRFSNVYCCLFCLLQFTMLLLHHWINAPSEQSTWRNRFIRLANYHLTCCLQR